MFFDVVGREKEIDIARALEQGASQVGLPHDFGQQAQMPGIAVGQGRQIV